MNLERICEQACRITQQVAQFLKAELGKVDIGQIEHKQRNHLVSYVDQTAEKMLVEALHKLVPEAAFLVEEATVEYEEKEWQWIIDPLDGTTNFLHQLPFFSISIALQYQHKTVIGIVHEVNNNQTFHSYKGGSAYLNTQKIHVSATQTLEHSLLATGFPYYDFEQVDAYLQMLKPLILNTRGIRRMGSAALDLAYVAAGRFDGYFEYSLSPWDVAAGAFLVEQAGGRVSDFGGGADYLHGKEIVAGNPAIFDYLVADTQQYFKK